MIIDLEQEVQRYRLSLRHALHVGAHHGEEDALYRRLGIEPIYVEANPEAFAVLRQALPDRECHPVAIADREGIADFHVTSFDQSSSLLPLKKHLKIYPGIVERCLIQVPCTTIDALLGPRRNQIDLINMDIQGAELLALRGASQTLPHVKCLVTEVNRAELYEGCGLMHEEAIILEDDCLPHPSFFPYCAELLRRYRDDERIVSIGGVNFQDGVSRSPHGYFFSKFFHCWGWASWRRVCRQYDRDLRTWPDFRDSGGLANWTDCPREEAFWRNLFERQHRGEFDSWAYAWLYSCWAQAGLSILPDVNLVSNIGFGDGAHHTRSSDSPLANRPTAPIRLGSPPACVVRCRAADQYTFLNYFRRPRGWRRWLCRIQRLRRRTAVGATRVATPD